MNISYIENQMEYNLFPQKKIISHKKKIIGIQREEEEDASLL